MSFGFIMPELIIESLIRDGLNNVRTNLEIIPDIFAQLTRGYNTAKYGAAEVAKIQALVTAKDIAVTYSYHDVESRSPCYSIMVGEDTEDKRRAQLEDFEEDLQIDITDPVKLAALIKVSNITATAYDPKSGKVSVVDGTDLSQTYNGLIFVDASDIEHPIVNGVDNLTGEKGVFIDRNTTFDFSGPCLIKSSLNFEQFEVKELTSDIKLVIGCHSKDALTTKYMYILLKYFIFSRKFDMIKRGMYLSSYAGSDFLRDGAYQGDHVFTRFLTVSGKVDDTWRADQVDLIDRVIIIGDPDDTPDED